jgi:predicted nucleic acid-binding protein
MNAELVDTNVVVYAYDPSTPEKHLRARALMERLWIERTGRLSVQVLQEFFWIATRKIPRPITAKAALDVVRDLAAWPVFSPTATDVVAAGELAGAARISFWDAMILQAARRSGARVVWSEDLNSGQILDGVEIRNPFAADAGG